jgi:putative SOS response-associated peptidase YedK
MQYSTFNARSEDFINKPSFRDAWKWGRRCLIVTDGFYEWKKLDGPKGKRKQAYSLGMADGGNMVMAGLWTRWTNAKNGETIESCTVLTCASNTTMADYHDRMPCILGEADWAKWLGEEPATEAELLALLRPCPDDWIKIWPVDNKVGNVKNIGPELNLPIDNPEQ